jgi:hypothetical protein
VRRTGRLSCGDPLELPERSFMRVGNAMARRLACRIRSVGEWLVGIVARFDFGRRCRQISARRTTEIEQIELRTDNQNDGTKPMMPEL